MPKITVGMCTGGTVRVETMTSLLSGFINMAQRNIALNLLVQVGGYVDVNRNVIFEECLSNGTTHLMFVDGDMIFPEDGFYKLLQDDKDIVGANYNTRLDPTAETLSGPTTKMLVDGVPVSMTSEGFPTELFKCYAIPTGFMMINLSKVNKLNKPVFESIIDKKGNHHTEDVEFCRKANKAGIEVWCDPTIKMGHIGSYTY